MFSLRSLVSTRRRRIASGIGVAAALMGASTVAFGLPWDLDMVDSQMVKAYEQPMTGLPEGVVSQPNVLSPKPFVASYGDFPHTSPEADALRAPFPADDAVLAEGEKYYGIYCTPCHGDGVTVGPVAKKGVPAPPLYGANGVLHTRLPKNAPMTDGYLYFTIRKGSLSTVMPAYGYTMTEEEMWSIVHWVRASDAKVVAAEPPKAPEPAPEGAPVEEKTP